MFLLVYGNDLDNILVGSKYELTSSEFDKPLLGKFDFAYFDILFMLIIRSTFIFPQLIP